MKKFLLINIPSTENAYNSFEDFAAIPLPVGLITIAAVLETLGYEVKIIDGDAERLNFEETLSWVIKEAPDYVGSTTMTATMDITGKFYAKLKKELSKVKIIVGGPHVSAVPEQTLREFAAIDIVVVGEGEETIAELMPILASGGELVAVKGLVFRENSRIIKTGNRAPIRDLGTTPIPAFHLLKFDLYRSYGWNGWLNGVRSPIGVVFTSRGCIGKCNFCGARCVFGQGMRFFPIDKIKEEIDLLVNKYNIRILYFQDDTFTVNRKMVKDICDYLITKGYNRKLEIMVSARVDTMHEPTLKIMRQAGIRWICFGVESGDQNILDRMDKGTTLKQIRQAFELVNKLGFCVVGNYMIGSLDETRETAMETIDLACKLKQDYASFSIAIPFPGTKLYQYCLDNSIKLPAWNEFGNVNTPPIPLNNSLDAESLMQLRLIAVNRFFKRPSYILSLLRKFNARVIIRDFIKMYFAIKKERKAGRF
ncbi:MAG: radical SAM protein [Candidatus Margulisiibacteriota bacterium]